MDTFYDLGLTQIIETPTRGASILDLFLTSNKNLVEKSSVVSGIGDHEFAIIITRLQIQRKKPPRRSILLWNKADESNIKSEACEFSKEFLLNFKNEKNIDKLWDHLRLNLLDIINKNVPSKISSAKRHQPWITSETKRILRKKQRWFNKAKKCNS